MFTCSQRLRWSTVFFLIEITSTATKSCDKLWLSGCVQQWDEVLPNGYKTSGLKLLESQPSKRLTWDGTFSKQRCSVAKELETGAVGYGATGKLLATICHVLHSHAAGGLFYSKKLGKLMCQFYIESNPSMIISDADAVDWNGFWYMLYGGKADICSDNMSVVLLTA